MSHVCLLFNSSQQPDHYTPVITKNCGNCDNFNGYRCRREPELKSLGKENEYVEQ